MRGRLHAGVSQRLSLSDDLRQNNPPLLEIAPLILRHDPKFGPEEYVEAKRRQAFPTDFFGALLPIG